jgi:DNA repair ATPase RecN
MTVSWNWPGSRWWRVDLHTHSPASHDFGTEHDRSTKDWAAWVGAARNQGLDAVAITDHNTPDGIGGLQEAARATGDFVVYPGIELTVGGIHLLCVLDPTRTRDHVLALLAQLGITPDKHGQHDATSSKTILQAIDIATELGALVIAAHVNGPKGLLVVLEGEERIKALRHPHLAGAELSPPPPDPSGWLDPASPSVQSWLDGSRPEIQRSIPQLWCSDSHCLDHAARGSTWVKMTRPDLDGLRLALYDGASSLRRHASGVEPNQYSANVIESISVHHAKYMGQPQALQVLLNPWLNAIIGSRGTGKSTLVDLFRLALGRDTELPEGGEGALRAAFDKRACVPVARGDAGLLRADTVVEIGYRKDGERFVITWAQGARAARIARLDGSALVQEEGDVRERFPVRIYSQKQLFDLARDPGALLSVIDDTAEVLGEELLRTRREAESKYLSLCADARALRLQAAELPRRRAALEDVRRKIALLEKGGHAKALNDYRMRRQQDDAWQETRSAVAQGIAQLEASTRAIEVTVPEALPELADNEFDALRRAYAATAESVETLRDIVVAVVGEADEKLNLVADGADLAAWKLTLASAQAEYARITEELRQAGIANPDEYRDLLDRAAEIEAEIKALESKSDDADERAREATTELTAYRRARDELSARRATFSASVSQATGHGADDGQTLVRVEIGRCTELDALEPFIRDTLGVVRFDLDLEQMVGRIAASTKGDGWSPGALDDVVKELRDLVEGQATAWPAVDRRFEAALRRLQPERVDRLALYAPDDRVDVSFWDDRARNGQWRKLSQGSPGQQTAALLAFVLGYGTEPIILDQPEDDLDSTLIYELLVQRLRERKRGRQIIVVTHNANIVVHGDAELVVSLEVNNGQTRVCLSAGLQERTTRDEICRVLEGGREAFESRYRRMTPGAKR